MTVEQLDMLLKKLQVWNEKLAQEIHNSARESVLSGATVAHDNLGEKATKFHEWNEITENARAGKRMQARYLLERYYIIPKLAGEDNHDAETNACASPQIN